MSDQSKLSPADESFIDDLTKICPREKLAIPGPLLPFFKSISSSVPETQFYKTVVPAFPAQFPFVSTSATSGTVATTIKDRFKSVHTNIDWLVPCPAYIAHLHHLLQEPLPQKVTFGADDSTSATAHTKNVDLVDLVKSDIGLNPDNLTMRVQLLSAPKRTVLKDYYPFDITKRYVSVSNATTNTKASYTRNNFGTEIHGSIADWTNDQKSTLTKLGINEPIMVHKDLLTQFVDNAYRSPIPVIDTPALDNTIETLADMMMMSNDYSWFLKLAGEMSIYSNFFPDSGTLADCSLSGPKFGQHVTSLVAPSTLPSRPTCFADPSSLPSYDNKIETSVSSSSMIIETVARYTCLNTQMYAAHPWLGVYTNFSARSGDFWTATPQFNTGTIDRSWLQDEVNIKRCVISRPKDVASK